MSIGDLVNLIQQGIFEILKVTAPILGAALIVGLIVAIFQANSYCRRCCHYHEHNE